MAPTDDVACTICYEAVNATIGLPCECKASYCLQCWDRCLAQSLMAGGKAKCPTCRTQVRADFDASTASLKFSREPAGADGEAPIDRNSIVERMTEQARPVQIQIIEEHVKAHPTLRELLQNPRAELSKLSILDLQEHIKSVGGESSSEDCSGLEKADLVDRLLVLLPRLGPRLRMMSARWAADAGANPPCVCGSVLYHVNGTARAQSQVEKILARMGVHPSMATYQELYAKWLTQITKNGIVANCDLCSKPMTWTSGMWTCRNDDLTILHATSWDVCDACFVMVACSRGHEIVQADSVQPVVSALEHRAHIINSEDEFLSLSTGLFALVLFLLALYGLKALRRSINAARVLQEPLMHDANAQVQV